MMEMCCCRHLRNGCSEAAGVQHWGSHRQFANANQLGTSTFAALLPLVGQK